MNPLSTRSDEDLKAHVKWLRKFEEHEALWGENGKPSVRRLDDVRGAIVRLLNERARRTPGGADEI